MFKKALSLLLALMLVVTSLTITAFSVSAADGDEETWILAGTESFFGSNWMESDVNNKMEAVGDGTFTKVYENVAASDATIQCKVTNGTWEVSYPEQNYEFKVVEACDVTFTFNPADGKLEVSGDGVELPQGLEIVGVNAVGAAVNDSPNWLNGISWDPGQNEMVEIEPGIWTATFEDCVENNNFQVKFALNGTQNKELGGTGWESNIGGTFEKTGVWTEGVWDGDNIALNLDDNDDDADDLIYDIVLTVDVNNFDYATKTGAKFKVDVYDKDGNALSFPVEEETETTAPAEEDTTAPEAEETTAAAAEPSDTLTVTATSNYFPTWTHNFSKEELEANNNLVTVSYFLDLGEIEMVNAQYTLTYDPAVLEYNAANNTHKVGKRSVETAMPWVQELGGVVYNPTFDDHTIKGNCSDAVYGYPMTDDSDHPVPFVTVTFVAKSTGDTTVNLDLEIMQIADKDAGETEYYYVKDSAVVKDGVEAKTQTSVYAGPFDDSVVNGEPETKPATDPVTDPVEETTAAPVETTAEPVEETTAAPEETTAELTEPETGDVLTVNAISNILGSTTQTFKDATIPETVTVKYYLNSDTATLVNAQSVITFDPAVLSFDPAKNQDKRGKSTLSPIATDWGASLVVNDENASTGELRVNYSEMNGMSLDENLPLFQIVYDVVGTGTTTVDNTVETITFKDKGTTASQDNWYQPQTLAGGFNEEAYNNLMSKATPKTTINDLEGDEPAPEVTTAEPTTAEPTTEPEETTIPGSDEEGYFYVVGNAALCPNGWSADAAIADADTQMHLNSDGLYEYVFENLPANEPKAMYQLKVIEAPDNDPAQVIWHGLDGTDLNVDFVVTQDCDVTVTYNPETGEILVTGDYVEAPSADFEVIRVVGGTVTDSPNYMNGISWNPAADENTMEKIADGLYSITFTDIVENNNLLLKFTADSQNSGDWSINWGGLAGEREETANGYVIEGPANYNGDNIVLDCEDDDDDVDFVYDLTITFDLRDFDATTKEGAKFTATFVRESDVEPTSEPVEPTSEPVEPTSEPVEPTSEPAEPTSEPVETQPEPETVTVNSFLNGEAYTVYTAEVNDTIEVVYAIQNDQKLISTQWTLTYDPSMLEIVDKTENFMPFTTAGQMYNTDVDGTIQGSVSDINGFDFSTETTFVKVTFKAVEPGESDVKLVITDILWEDVVEPTSEPAEPTSEPAEPTSEPAEPTSEPAEPTSEPVEPTSEPVEPTSEPVEPTSEPVEPTSEPVEPTSEPVEPTSEPVESTSEPVEPTSEPAEPTSEPAEPTSEPVETQPETTVPEETTVEPATDATSATDATVAPTTTGKSTSDTPSNNNSNNSSNGAVKTGSASMALIILIVLLSATAAIFFARKRERK